MSESKTVGVTVDPKATPLEAGSPVEMPAELGSTFAERAAARSKGSKQVKADDTEDKAVSSSESKSRRSAKK